MSPRLRQLRQQREARTALREVRGHGQGVVTHVHDHQARQRAGTMAQRGGELRRGARPVPVLLSKRVAEDSQEGRRRAEAAAAEAEERAEVAEQEKLEKLQHLRQRSGRR